MLNLGNGNKLNLMVHIAGNNSGLLRAIRGGSQAVNAFKRTLAASSKSAYKLADAGVGIKDMMASMRKMGNVQATRYFKDMHLDMLNVRKSFKHIFSSYYKLKSTINSTPATYTETNWRRAIPGQNAYDMGAIQKNMSRVTGNQLVKSFSVQQTKIPFFDTLGKRLQATKNMFVSMGSAAGNLFKGLQNKMPVTISLFNGLTQKVKEVTMGFIKWGSVIASFAFAKFAKDSAGVYLELSKARAQLEQLGLKGKKQKQMFKGFKKISKDYGISMSDLTKASVRFYSAGVKSSKKVAKSLKLIADASLYSGQSFEEMGHTMSKALAGGYMDLTEFWQLNDRGIITLQDLKGKLGNNIEEIMQNVSKRKLTTEIASEIIEKKTGGFHKKASENLGAAATYFQNSYKKLQETFASVMVKSLGGEKSLAGQLHGLGEKLPAIGKTLGEIAGKLAVIVVNFATGLNAGLTPLYAIISGFVQIITLGNTTNNGLKVLSRTAGFLVGIIASLKIATVAWKGVLLACKGVVVAYRGVMLTLKGIQIAFNFLVGLWNALLYANPIGAIVLACMAVIGVLVLIIKYWKEIWGWIKKVGKGIKNFFKGGWKKMFGIGGKATGTPGFYSKTKGYADGGVVRVNERGGELISLPNGSTVIPHDYTHKLMNNNNRVELSPEIMDNIISKAVDKIIYKFSPKMDQTNIGIERMNNGTILAV